ncbi:TPA: hypothetical protein KNI71_002549 [Clostridioides difficile]|nr:hypothetical protein [Clostridioides difficile]
MKYLDRYTNEEISELLNTLDTNKVAEIMKFDKSKSHYMPRKRVINMMMNNLIKSDCFDVENENYHGLRAYINLNEQITENTVVELLKKIATLKVAPSRVFVDYDVVHLFFQPKKKIYFKDNIEYLRLIFNFIDFIENNGVFENMIFFGWSLNNPEFISLEADDEDGESFNLERFDAKVTLIRGLIEGKISQKESILEGGQEDVK